MNSYTSVTVNGNVAAVKAVVTQWARLGSPDSATGTVTWIMNRADVSVTDELVQDAAGDWQVAQRDQQYLPGSGPGSGG